VRGSEGESESERERVRERERESKRERWKICIFDYSMHVCRASTSMLLLTSLDSLAVPSFLRDIPTSEALHHNEKIYQFYFRNIHAHDDRCETVSQILCIYLLFAKNRVKVHLHLRVCMIRVRKLKTMRSQYAYFTRAHTHANPHRKSSKECEFRMALPLRAFI